MANFIILFISVKVFVRLKTWILSISIFLSFTLTMLIYLDTIESFLIFIKNSPSFYTFISWYFKERKKVCRSGETHLPEQGEVATNLYYLGPHWLFSLYFQQKRYLISIFNLISTQTGVLEVTIFTVSRGVHTKIENSGKSVNNWKQTCFWTNGIKITSKCLGFGCFPTLMIHLYGSFSLFFSSLAFGEGYKLSGLVLFSRFLPAYEW